jgi:hypothetical protein
MILQIQLINPSLIGVLVDCLVLRFIEILGNGLALGIVAIKVSWSVLVSYFKLLNG